MVTITGGKLTTWRRMAKLTVDRLVERDARDAPCRTHEISLGQPVAAEQLTRVGGVAESAYAALAGRYGHAAEEVLATAAERPELAAPIVTGFPDLVAEVVYAVRSEQARSLGDVLLRRTRLALLAAHEVSDGAAAQRVAAALAAELGWDAVSTAVELERYATELAAEGVDVSARADGSVVAATLGPRSVVAHERYDGRAA
jgi:glycerol-3-phosphate dehydrogenase